MGNLDPKQVLESFRTSSPLDGFRTDRHPFPIVKRKQSKQSPFVPAALALCLITGVGVGTTSAYANGDLAPSQTPIDEPSATIHQVKEEITSIPSEKKDFAPSSFIPIEKQKKSEQKKAEVVTPNSQVIENKGIVSDPNTKPPTEKPIQKEQPKWKDDIVSSPIKNKEVVKDMNMKPLTEKTVQKEQQPTSKQDIVSSSVENKATTKPLSVVDPVTKVHGSKTNSTKTVATSQVKQEETIQMAKNQMVKPKTVAGGELPKTAGGDLTNVAIGSAAALFGALYILRRRVEASE